MVHHRRRHLEAAHGLARSHESLRFRDTPARTGYHRIPLKSPTQHESSRCVARDVETLFDIRCSVRENHQSREELADIGVTTQSVREMIAGGDYVTIIAVEDARAVGFTMAQISEGWVFACFVRPAFEGRGVGRVLMNAAEAGLRSAGVKRVWLSTGPGEHLRAMGFYRHLGWRHDGYLGDGQLRFTKEL